MIDASSLAVFLGAAVLLTLAPGPDIIFLTATSIAQGRRAGLATAMGLATGSLVHTSAAALGISAILATSAWAFAVVKYAGAAYLAYLAWQAFKHREHFLDLESGGGTRGGKSLYIRGFFMNVLNPKVALFFLAFLPQFADPALGPVWRQILFLGLLFALNIVVVFSLVAICAGQVGGWLKRAAGGRAPRFMAYGVSAVFLGLAVRLMAVER